jgi:hypothetical protein
MVSVRILGSEHVTEIEFLEKTLSNLSGKLDLRFLLLE